ncbi:alpha-1,2-fucosyltransferase [Polynucleobacter paneuropaeus]|nr:alpha-1,2-fucosyltransferase [Polynucleobacter paneuropaeus]
MIVSHILGGLGNQMFQYAAGRALSIRIGSELFVDLSSFKNYELHNGYELDRVFGIESEIASQADLGSLLGWRRSNGAKRILGLINRQSLSGNLTIEPHFHYWSGINQVQDNSYLDGYWQSEKYFSDIKNIIKNDFTFKPKLDIDNENMLCKIKSSIAVGLHVRRGDYILNKKAAKVMHLCDLEYYKKAINHFIKRFQNPKFFIFSDDPGWAFDTFQNFLSNFEIVTINSGVNSYVDMQLMASCNHNIIANSSFSWWGAWLNDNPEKIIVSPRKWFFNNRLNSVDLYCKGWIIE